jgi:hypothetical protein
MDFFHLEAGDFHQASWHFNSQAENLCASAATALGAPAQDSRRPAAAVGAAEKRRLVSRDVWFSGR